MRSKAQLLKDWLGLLRSGQYEQTREVLHDDKGYCCLGVAAEGLFGVEWDFDDSNEWYDYCEGTECAFDYTLIPSHAEAMGLDHEVGEDEARVLTGIVEYITSDWNTEDTHKVEDAVYSIIPGSSRENWLIHLNDAGFTFEQIADFIQIAGWIKEAETEERIAKLSALTQELEEE